MYLHLLLNKCKENMNLKKAIVVLYKVEFKAKALIKCSKEGHFNQKMVILVTKIKTLKNLMHGLI